jgi:HupE / UreJ protein
MCKGVRLLVLGLLSILAMPLCGLPAGAHIFKTSVATFFLPRDGASFSLRLGMNAEWMLAGIDPKLNDSSKSPQGPEYDRLRALPPEELERVFKETWPHFLDDVRIEADGKRITPTVDNEIFPEVGDIKTVRASFIILHADLPPGTKALTFGWAARLGTITVQTVSIHSKAIHIEVLENGETSAPMVIDELRARTTLDMIGDFVTIGFEHIVPRGLDHILFVMGIFLLSIRLKPILVQVTSFTVAHTMTLGLGTLGYVNLPANVVEPLIAASIVYVAVENIFRPTLSIWRPAVVFCFGLLHGLGFAGALRQIGIPEGDFVLGLLSFNVGVELGQLSVIALGYALVGIWFGNKPWYRQRVVIPGSLVIAGIGAFWVVERTLL